MFNTKQKTAYIRHLENNERLRNITIGLFIKSELYEKELDKDIADFSKKEILDYYTSLKSASKESLININSHLKFYAQYCIDERLSNSNNGFKEITKADIVPCVDRDKRKGMIVTREQLLKDITFLPNVCDQFLVLAIFEGIYGKRFFDLLYITGKDFDKEPFVTASGVELKPSDKLKELAHESQRTFTYFMATEYGTFIETPFHNDEWCLKRIRNAIKTTKEAREQQIRGKLFRIVGYIGLKYFSAKPLLESGRIYMIKQFMKQDGTELRETILKHKEEIERVYGNISIVSSYIDKYKEFYED